MIGEALLQECVVRLETRFEVVVAMMQRKRSVEICLAKVVVQKRDDRSGLRIRCEIVGVVANHGAQTPQEVG